MADLQHSTIPYDVLSQYRIFRSQYDDPTRAQEVDAFAAALRAWFLDHAPHILEDGGVDRGDRPSPSTPGAVESPEDLLSVQYRTRPWSVPVIELDVDIPTRHGWIDLAATVENLTTVAQRCRLSVAMAPRSITQNGDPALDPTTRSAAETTANEEVYRVALELSSLVC